MNPNMQNQAIEAAEQKIAALTARVEQAKEVVQQWITANSNLSHSAATARAQNQSSGRGFLGAVLGSKFRSAMRSAAASSNASIAKTVAEKRATIASKKLEAQNRVKQLQSELAEAKQELKALTSSLKTQARGTAKTAKASLSLLQQLKEAHDCGLLTEAEYEEKRRRLVSTI